MSEKQEVIEVFIRDCASSLKAFTPCPKCCNKVINEIILGYKRGFDSVYIDNAVVGIESIHKIKRWNLSMNLGIKNFYDMEWHRTSRTAGLLDMKKLRKNVRKALISQEVINLALEEDDWEIKLNEKVMERVNDSTIWTDDDKRYLRDFLPEYIAKQHSKENKDEARKLLRALR